MVWLVVLLVAAPVIVGFWLARQMNVRPDDALAMRLASELGTAAPTFDTSKPAWRLELDGAVLWVGAHHLSAARAVERAVTEPFTVLDGPLGGHEQEEYRLPRVLVPNGEGGWCVGGRSEGLTAQEERVVAARPAGRPALASNRRRHDRGGHAFRTSRGRRAGVGRRADRDRARVVRPIAR